MLRIRAVYRRLHEDVRLWVQDRPDVMTVSKPAELAEEFVSRRALDSQRECHNKKTAWGKGQPSKEKNRARYAESSEKKKAVKEAAQAQEDHHKNAF